MTKYAPPTPAQIKAARKAAGLTQKQAGDLIKGSMRAFQDYEGGQRHMHPGLFELFSIKTGSGDGKPSR